MNKKTKKATYICTECKISKENWAKCKLETEDTSTIGFPGNCPYLIGSRATKAIWKRVKEKK